MRLPGILTLFDFDSSPPRYAAFLVRMWQERPNALWHAMARHVLTGEVHHFGNLESLFLFLHQQTEVAQPKDDIYHEEHRAVPPQRDKGEGARGQE